MMDASERAGSCREGAEGALGRIIAVAAERGDRGPDAAMEEIRRATGAQAACLYLIEDKLLRRIVFQSEGVEADSTARAVSAVVDRADPLPACMAAASGQIVHVPDAGQLPPEGPQPLDRSIEEPGRLRIENVLAVPLVRPTVPSIAIRHIRESQVVAVAELINHRDVDGRPCSFPRELPQTLTPVLDLLALLAENRQLRRQLTASVEDAMRRLSRAAELREDPHSTKHIMRMSHVCGILAQKLGLPAVEVDLIRLASPMHDLGKIGVSETVLFKEGRLDGKERAEIQEHAEIGKGLLDGSRDDLLRTAYDIAVTHHERWDGRGYPNQLQGEDIPIAGRIAALADVFDALMSRRCYKDPMPVEKAQRIVTEERGKHFDPQVVDAFFSGLDEILDVYETLPDE